jgi:hypothetical protein
MGIRALLVVGAIVVVCCWWGGQQTYVAIRDRDQLTISCADYVNKRPDARWLKLTDCEYDFEHLAYEEGASRYRTVYLPLRPAGDSSGPAVIIVKREDRELLDVVWALEHDEEKPAELDRVMTDLMKPTEGLVEFGLDLDDKEQKALAGLGLGLAKDFVIIDHGDEPKLAKGIMVLMLGLGGIATLAYLILRGRRPPKTPPPTHTPPPMKAPSSPIAAFEREV